MTESVAWQYQLNTCLNPLAYQGRGNGQRLYWTRFLYGVRWGPRRGTSATSMDHSPMVGETALNSARIASESPNHTEIKIVVGLRLILGGDPCCGDVIKPNRI